MTVIAQTLLRSLCWLLCVLVLTVPVAYAAPQQNQQTQSEPEASQQDSQQVQDSQQAQPTPDTDQAAEPSLTEGDDEEAPSRFIPTEDISEDLGVSFPIDI